MANKNFVKVGLFGVGLDTYWGQFDGLLERLIGYQDLISSKMTALGNVEVVNAGLIDTPEKSYEAADLFKAKDVEMVFVFISTYALSSTVLPAVSRLKVPVIILNIQPDKAIDYAKLNAMTDRGKMTGEWLANCQACSVPEFACVFNNADIKYDIVTGYLADPEAWQEISDWIDAARLSYGMRTNKLGVMGNYYGGMVDVYTDLRLQSATFGTHIDVVEMCELNEMRKSVTNFELSKKIEEFNSTFKVETECSDCEIKRAALTSVALDKLIEKRKLGSMAYYYEGANANDYENIITSVIAGNTLLTGKGVPIAGEYEVKTAQAMKILSILGAGGSFAEFYGMDFEDDVVLLGHDGPAHFNSAQEQVKLVPLPIYHGKPGKGLSIQMTVKYGDVTLLSVVETKGKISLLIAEAESVSGEVMHIGNTNSRYKFSVGAKKFIDSWSKQGPSHHCAIGIGKWANVLKKYAFFLGIDAVQVS